MTLEYRVADDDPEKEKLISRMYARSPQEPLPKFPEVTGICRTCDNAFILRRQYSEVPMIRCQAFGANNARMPLDIAECTGYQRRGQTSLRDMAELALLIDQRKSGGQYL